jgi:hypothetical protein
MNTKIKTPKKPSKTEQAKDLFFNKNYSVNYIADLIGSSMQFVTKAINK